MQSSSFRLISAAISIFLLAALVTVIVVVIRDNPATALPVITPTEAVAQAAAASANATLAAAPTLSTDNIEAVTPTPTELAIEENEENTEENIVENTENAEAEPQATESVTAAPTSATRRATGTSQPAGTTVAIPNAATSTPAPTPIPPTFDPETGPLVNVYSNGNFVNGIASLRSTLWTATSGGVVAWNKGTGSYVKFTTADGLAANHTLSAVVCPLPGLGILFAGPLGIQIFDTQNGSWKTLNSSNSEMSYDEVSTLWCSASDGLLIVGYARAGLDIFNSREGSWRYVGEDEGLSVTNIRDIAVLDNGATIWMATPNGLALYADGETTIFTTENSPLQNNRIEAIAADGSGAIWLTSADTLYRTDNDEWDSYNANNGDFPSGRLVGLDVSNNGTIWIGSDQTQLCRFDPGVGGCIAFFSGDEGMAAAPLTSLMIDNDGEVYYTTSGGGISIFDGDAWRQLLIDNEVTPGNSINAITQASDGAYWLAGNGGGSQVTFSGTGDSQSVGVENFTPANSELPSINVRVIFPTATGVWFGTETATFFDGETWTTYGPDEGLTGTAVQAITADAQNRIWLGTNAGLSIWTGSAFFNLTSSNGLPSEDITTLQTDGSAVWIGTRGGGLLRFQDNQLQLFNRSNSNLPADTINDLALAENGDLLIATERGLARYSGDELVAETTLDTEAVTAIAVAPNGEVWIATALHELQFFNGVEWAILATEKLPAPEINTLFFDEEGTLWIGTAQGGAARFIP